jgi:hypothetical protein
MFQTQGNFGVAAPQFTSAHTPVPPYGLMPNEAAYNKESGWAQHPRYLRPVKYGKRVFEINERQGRKMLNQLGYMESTIDLTHPDITRAKLR